MRNLFGVGFLLLLSVVFAARLPLDFTELSSTKSQHDELESQLPDQSLDSEQSMEDDDDALGESSPIKSRYEVPDSESSEDIRDYDSALEEILEDIVVTLQTHPDLLKELMNKDPDYSNRPEAGTDYSNRPEAGREIIDDNYPHTDMSEESRELDQFLTNIQHRAHDNPDNDIQESAQDDAFVNIQEGGQYDPMFDYERVNKPKNQHAENTHDSIITESQENSSKSEEDSSDSEQDGKADTISSDKVQKIDSQEIETEQHSSNEADRLMNPRSPKYRID